MNFPVTTPFGWVKGYPLNQTDPVGRPGMGYHNGIDYGYPQGTSVVVNGVTIGLSNNTGATTGPHLHIGKYVGGTAVDPGVGNGLVFNSAVIFDTGYDATNGNYVRITADGGLWNYLHLESILVTKGQVLKEATVAEQVLTENQFRILAYSITGFNGVNGAPNALNGDRDGDMPGHVGQPLDQQIDVFWNSDERKRWTDQILPSLTTSSTQYEAVPGLTLNGKQMYQLKGE